MRMIEILRLSVTRTMLRAAARVAPADQRLAIRNYWEASKSGRRLRFWQPGAPGPNSAVLSELDQLRRRSRDSVRNNAWLSHGITSRVSNEVGCSVTMRSASSNEEFRKRADDLWERQTRYFDADGVLELNGMLSLTVRTRNEAGEIFWRRRPRDAKSGLPVPLQYQLLEPEFCPVNETRDLDNGRKIRAGIEFDGIGRRRAYWMYRGHPGDRFNDFNALDLVPVPAESILHHYKPLRAGQIRGVPALVQALIKAKDFDEYDDAELLRKKNRAAYTGVITKKDISSNEWAYDPMTGKPINTEDDADIPTLTMEPGQWASLLPGEDIKPFDGDTTGQGYKDFCRQQLLGAATGIDLPYEFISGDFSAVNDRVFRVVLAEFHRIIEQDRWHFIIPQILYPVWADFIDMAVLSGALDAPGYEANYDDYVKVECHPEGWPYLHELQDAQADALRIKSGLTSRKRVAAERGEDIREIDRENEEDKARAEKAGLNYDTEAADKSIAGNPPADPNADPQPSVNR
jgi:lambda family phage portal protein